MILSEKLYNLIHKKWNFDRARELYEDHGESETMKFLFAQGYSSFIEAQLREAIQELAIDHPIVEHEIKSARKEEMENPRFLPAKIPYPEDELNYPAELQELVKKRKGLFSRSNHSRYLLFTKAENEAERKNLALQIKEDWREIERIWGILNFWKVHRTLSPDLIQVNTGQMTIKEMNSRIRNLTTYISKTKSGKKKYKMPIEEMMAELNDLRRRMDGIV